MKPKQSTQKILSRNALGKKLSKLKGKHFVFTNGCFDILHAGHVQYLEKARTLGDGLILALNDDASVKRLKGKTRPLNQLKDRMRVIAALGCVDYVTWFSEDTPLKTILTIKPKVLVKGGDWKLQQIVGAKEVISWDGKVYSLPFLKGRSTTKLIQKAQKN